MRYLFKSLNILKRQLKAKKIFLFLDYDGTLTPIASRPKQATLPKATKALLRRLQRCQGVKIALISGRSLKDVKALVGVKDVVYAGNHGLEIKGSGLVWKNPLVTKNKKVLTVIKQKLKKSLKGIKGVLIEDKGLTLSVHYRCVKKAKQAAVKKLFQKTVLLFLKSDKIKTSEGKKVLEIRPPLKWHKGKAVQWLLSQWRKSKKHHLAIYVGDDVTDEDAFGILGSEDLSVIVGKKRRTRARYFVKNTQDVNRLLREVLKAQGECHGRTD